MSWLGQLRYRLRGAWVDRFLTYDAQGFARALAKLGVTQGDTLFIHASLGAHSGYKGRPAELLAALKERVGSQGLLVMPSMTYSDSTRAFLLRGEAVRQRTSPSQMGLLSEVFRRGRDVHRSLSPAHPLLAWGRGAEAFLAGHESTVTSFGKGSPFDRLLDLEAKILCIDAIPESITFTHYLEDRYRARLSIDLYDAEPISGRVIGADGREHVIPTLVLSDTSRRLRDEAVLWRRVDRSSTMRQLRLGNTTMRVVRCRDLDQQFEAMLAAGEPYFGQAKPG